ncbi:MAG: hypothetical protein B6D35_14190 [Candidatus Brocadia sp. UTAMX2]|nr:MAG: hypothetical protein B6D35_14190 [Candidatus Brocadia sp. UTAMX2]
MIKKEDAFSKVINGVAIRAYIILGSGLLKSVYKLRMLCNFNVPLLEWNKVDHQRSLKLCVLCAFAVNYFKHYSQQVWFLHGK